MQNIKWWTLITGILIGLLSAGIIILVTSSPRGNPIELPPPPTPSPIMVDISGAVYSPGLYSLAIDSRIVDLIELAGGLLPTAIQESINLAQILEDGQRVFIAENEATISNSNSNSSTQLININIANILLLSSLPGIGEGKANEIITFRQQNGAFSSIEGIMSVPGIGNGTFENLKHLISISATH